MVEKVWMEKKTLSQYSNWLRPSMFVLVQVQRQHTREANDFRGLLKLQ